LRNQHPHQADDVETVKWQAQRSSGPAVARQQHAPRSGSTALSAPRPRALIARLTLRTSSLTVLGSGGCHRGRRVSQGLSGSEEGGGRAEPRVARRQRLTRPTLPDRDLPALVGEGEGRQAADRTGTGDESCARAHVLEMKSGWVSRFKAGGRGTCSPGNQPACRAYMPAPLSDRSPLPALP
jgi:hypothetical protein